MEEIKKESTGSGNVILLTVIAIVTMIIVVIGATFAYLASSVQDGDQSNINATTEGGSDLLIMNAGEDVNLLANVENFHETAGNLSGEMDASVILQTTNSQTVSYDYRVFLSIPHNDFEYSSGKCYVKPASGTVVAESAQACRESGNVWATQNGSTYECYGNPSDVANTFYTNEVTCLSNKDYIWATSDVAELVIDLYQSTGGAQEPATCIASGVCVDSSRNIVSGANTENACTTASETNTWLPNIYDDGICYNAVKTADITTLTTEDGFELSLLDKVTISATDGSAGHYYKAMVTLINFGHNQIVNGNKSFNGILNFERIVPDVQG